MTTKRKRPFVDAPQAIRCRATIIRRDDTMAQCGRRRTHGIYCWQHSDTPREDPDTARSSPRLGADVDAG